MTGLLAHSDHDNFAVVGMAVPDRIKLFRAQMGRAVGANSRRTSVSSLIHNDLCAVAVSQKQRGLVLASTHGQQTSVDKTPFLLCGLCAYSAPDLCSTTPQIL